MTAGFDLLDTLRTEPIHDGNPGFSAITLAPFGLLTDENTHFRPSIGQIEIGGHTANGPTVYLDFPDVGYETIKRGKEFYLRLSIMLVVTLFAELDNFRVIQPSHVWDSCLRDC